MKTAEGLGAWHNNYNDRPLAECVERAKRARLDFVIVKYGYPDVEQAYADAGVPWATERYVYINQPENEGNMLADAVDAGACFAVINAEEGEGGWGPHEGGRRAMRTLCNTFRSRHLEVPLYACLDTRGDRLNHPYQQEALDWCNGIMPMVYPGAFYPTRTLGYIARAFDDALHGKDFQGTPIFPVLQSYGTIGARIIEPQFRIANVWGDGCSFYTIHHATDAEWDAVCNLKPKEEPEQTGAGKLVLELAHRIEVMKLAADGDWTGLRKELDKRGH